MTTYQWLVGLHVIAAFLFVSGALMVGLVHTAALRRERPSEIALLLGLTRIGVVVVAAGAAGSLVLGIALVDHLPYRSIGDTWIAVSLGLWTASLALGAIGGRSARKARYLARRLADTGDAPNADLRRLLTEPVGLALNYGSLLAALAVLALMIWKPS